MAVQIDIVGQFSGKRAFKEADTAVGALTKSAAKLAASLGVVRLAQKSMLNAMADQKAAKILAQNLKNIGLAYAQIPAEQFIQNMQKQTGILDDELRPAFAQLARVTGSIAKSQELMGLAFDVSAGSGQDFSRVIDALSQAYVGNTKGLKSLNIGLTQAELKSKSFAEISEILNKQFGGAGAASLDTYAGKLALLKVAAADASETIGMSLLDALTKVSGSTGMQDFISKIDTAAGKIADLITLGSRVVQVFQAIGSPSKGIGDLSNRLSGLFKRFASEDLAKTAAKANAGMSMWRPQGYQSPAEKKAEADARKRANELLAAQKSANKLALNNAKLQKAAAVFDMKKIQITAALKSATDQETITRLKLMLAIENEQGDLAEKLSKKLDEITEKNKSLKRDFDEWQTLGKGFNPFEGFIGSADALIAKVQEVTGVMLSNSIAMKSFAMGLAQGLSVPESLSGARYAAQGAATYAASGGTPVINNITVNGALDPNAVADQINTILTNSTSIQGYSDTYLPAKWLGQIAL